MLNKVKSAFGGKKALSSLWLSATMLVSSAMPVLAAEEKKIILDPQGTFFEDLYNLTIPGLISGAVKLVMIIAALVFFFLLIVGGIQWMTSGGDKAATEAARGRITAALIGLVVVFSAWAIATLLKTLFGVDIFGLEFPSLI